MKKLMFLVISFSLVLGAGSQVFAKIGNDQASHQYSRDLNSEATMLSKEEIVESLEFLNTPSEPNEVAQVYTGNSCDHAWQLYLLCLERQRYDLSLSCFYNCRRN